MGGKSQPNQVADYTGVNLQTSAMSLPVPLGWGKARGSPNLIDYVDFKVHKQQVGKGAALGKGTEFTYSAAIVMALCEGPINDITKTYENQGWKAGFDSGFTLFKGTTPQSPWSYMTTNHPDHAYPYQGICHLDHANFNLGTSEALPSQSFEIELPLWNTGFTGGGDADCALVVQDFLTNSQYGALFPTARIDNTTLLSGPDAPTTGDSAYQTYCQAMGWGISPFIQNQEAASDILSRWLYLTNTAPVWTGYSLKLVPWGDDTVTGNGVTYVPPTTAVFSFGDDDYLQDGDNDPIQQQIRDWFDAYNSVAIECSIRDYDYNPVPIDWIDQTSNELVGRRQASRITAHEICDTDMATQVVSLIGARMLYVRRTFTARFPPHYDGYEPMDVGTITDVKLGLIDEPVRIVDIDEDEEGILTFTFEEFPGVVGQPTTNASTGVATNPINSQVTPDSVNTPLIFEPSSTAAQFLTGSSAPIVVAAVSGGSGGAADPNWGGCDVWISADGTTYAFIGTISQPARMGGLTANLASYSSANPDTGHTLSVSLAESGGTLASASSSATAAAGATLVVVQDSGGAIELIGPETATLTGANAYDLTNLYRGLYGTAGGAHTTGALFARLDNAVFTYALPADYIGATLYFKFASFNIWGQQKQDVSTCTAYTYTPSGAGYGGGTGGVPTTPTGLNENTSTGAGQVALSWNTNPATDNVATYTLWQASGAGASFGSAVAIWTGLATSHVVTGLAASAGFTFFLTANNSVGASANTSGVNATTTAYSFASDVTINGNLVVTGTITGDTL